MTNETPPEMPDLGGKIPDAWNALIDTIGRADTRKRPELEARLQVWMLFADLRARQFDANAAKQHADSMVTWTKVLAGATVVLAIATVALIFATLSA